MKGKLAALLFYLISLIAEKLKNVCLLILTLLCYPTLLRAANEKNDKLRKENYPNSFCQTPHKYCIREEIQETRRRTKEESGAREKRARKKKECIEEIYASFR